MLVFDGGIRGNPGPGVSGSFIVYVGSDAILPRIHCMASVSYAARSTTIITRNTEVYLLGYARRSSIISAGSSLLGTVNSSSNTCCDDGYIRPYDYVMSMINVALSRISLPLCIEHIISVSLTKWRML